MNIKKQIPSIFAQMPYLELKGNRELLLEGCKGILEYTTETIRINTGTIVLVILGRNLNLKCLSQTGLIVDGFIMSIEFVS